MARDGAGNYTLPSGNPVVPNTIISSGGWANPTLSDIAAAITQSLSKDGQTTPTANLPMGNFRHINVANAANRTDYAAAGQVQDSTLTTLSAIAGTDTITANSAPPITAYTAGQCFDLIPAGANTTSSVTLNINGLGAKAVTKLGTVPLAPGDLTAVLSVRVRYDGTQFQVISPLTSPPSMRNRFINGMTAVDQRNSGAAQTITAGAALAYTVDRWYAYCTGANVTGQRVSGSGASQYRYQFTGAASVSAIGFGQRIETANSYDLNNSTATFSVDLANSLLTTVTWTAYYANSTDSFGTLASPTRTQIATGTFTVNSTIARYSAQIAIPSAAITGVEVVLTVGAQTSGTWTIGNLRMEPGTVPDVAERRPLPLELLMCQRYLPAFLSSAASGLFGCGQNFTTSGGNIALQFPVQPRVVPTGLTTSGGFALTVNNGSLSPVTSLTFNSASLTGASISVAATGTPMTAGNATELYSQSTSSNILFTGCEL